MKSVSFFFYIGVCVTVFILAYYYFIAFIISFVFLCVLFLLYKKYFYAPQRQINNKRYVGVILLAMTGFFLAIVWSSIYLYFYVKKWPENLTNRTVYLCGQIVSLPIIKPHAIQFDFLTQKINYQPQVFKLRLTQYGQYYSYSVGETWCFDAKVKPVNNYNNLGSFNYKGYLKRYGIPATGYIKKTKKVMWAQGFYVDRFRAFLVNKIKQAFKDNEVAGIFIALMVGIRSDVSQEQWALFRQTGTSHLMAISGLHIGLMAAFFYFLLNILWRMRSLCCECWPAQKAGAFASILGALSYGLLSGFSLSTQRACIVVTTIMAAKLCNYKTSMWHSYMFSLLVVLLCSPLSVTSVGFYLSFFAVFVLLLLSTFRYKKNVIILQLYLCVAMFPLSAYLFNFASFNTALANIVIIPVFSFFIVPIAFLALLLSFLSTKLSHLLWQMDANVLQYSLNYLSFLMYHDYTFFILIVSQLSVVLLATIGFLLLCLPIAFKQKYLTAFFYLPLFYPAIDRPPFGEAWFYLLDVGQGLASVVLTHKHVLVYDTGPKFRSGFDLGKAVVLPFLRKQHIRHVDAVVVSHEDLDHRGGLRSIKKAIPIKTIYRSEKREKKLLCHHTKPWQWDGVKFSFIGDVGKKFSSNDKSCVLKIENKYNSVLLTGDIEKKREAELVKNNSRQLVSTVLVAPHHGSNTSSSNAFIASVKAKTVLFSVGKYNRYHFPNKKVIARYQNMGTKTLTTSDCGMLFWQLGKYFKTVVCQKIS